MLLAIETASVPGSIALFSPDGLVEFCPLASTGRSRALAQDIGSLLERHGGVEGLSAIGLSIGPGSFTGIRVGVSFAKGFAVAREIVVIPVSTLEAIAAGMARARPESRTFLVLTDARGGEVYAAAFRRTIDGIEPHPLVPEGAYAAGFAPEVEPGVLVAGSGVSLVARVPATWALLDAAEALSTPSAEVVGRLALRTWRAGGGGSAETIEPRYVSRPKVERDGSVVGPTCVDAPSIGP